MNPSPNRTIRALIKESNLRYLFEYPISLSVIDFPYLEKSRSFSSGKGSESSFNQLYFLITFAFSSEWDKIISPYD